MALAAAGGAAVVQAAGTDLWAGFRQRVAQLLGRGDTQREQAELERLDRTAAVVRTVGPDTEERARIVEEVSWRTRFETLLESSAPEERALVAAELRALLADATPSTATSASAGGFAAGGRVDIHAESGAIAAGVINGEVRVGTPWPPGPSQG
ncbi:hypothetical protein SLV14_000104 [Streptomyces sp. Je 1-4]|uniref:hypothetical protein n=1 Tax=Streptomyces TaxID=1883 RepID=UPI0021D94AA1|nr:MULTISPECIES: hypothetical protein [unclassified Streptomyces]UYB37820.1 hypothetical protein SLV14_000104 [Streptomyces sp. Je 1-4]UZQ33739.1 hypothetical protein SLV14N_000104 [Streptomyces sp. Je 1-4] [Streptomyces sp. Je 1-4 4N24]UZQ41157.1 hypothetical protein SLV14NA_000104 [Streptomyces sp. Je 1-4] [Streptomyces sp. Je 1-4 4N24_ara]